MTLHILGINKRTSITSSGSVDKLGTCCSISSLDRSQLNDMIATVEKQMT